MKKTLEFIAKLLAVSSTAALVSGGACEYGALDVDVDDGLACCDGVAQYEKCYNAWSKEHSCNVNQVSCCKDADDYEQCAEAFENNGGVCPEKN